MSKKGTFIPRAEVRRYGPWRNGGRNITRRLPADAWKHKPKRADSPGPADALPGARNDKFAHWTHAALFVSEDGMLVEAVEPGVQERNVRVYRDTEYHVVHLQDASEEGCEHPVAFAMHCLHDSYGFLTDISLFFTPLFATKIFFGVDLQMICSGLVARALERTGAIFQYHS